MKLHLPSKLRAALLAVVSAVAAAPATTLAANNVAVYDYTYFQHASQVHANLRENSAIYDDPDLPGEQKDDNFDFRNPLATDPTDTFFDSAKNDWTLTIEVHNFLPCVGEDERGDEGTLSAMLFGNCQSEVNDNTGDTILVQENSFTIDLDRFGNVRLNTNYEANTIDNDLVLFNVGLVWDEDDREENQTVSLRMTLSWDADGGLYMNTDGDKYGALTLQSAYLLSNDESHSVVKEITSFYTGRVILNNYEMQDDLLSVKNPEATWSEKGGCLAVSGEGGTAIVTLLTPGADPAWCIKGNTSIKYLLEGRYKDNTIASNRAMDETERVNFYGATSNLWLTSGEYTYANPTWACMDPLGENPGVGIGFGAEAGATITVDKSVISSTVLASGATVNALGDGTVRLGIDTTEVTGVELPGVVVAGGTTNRQVTDIAAGERTIVFNQLGANTNVELDVTGNAGVTVVLGSATIGNQNENNTVSITRLDQNPDDSNPSGALTVQLDNGSGTQKTSYVGTLENKEGNLHIEGRETVNVKDKEGKITGTKTVYSRLKAAELISYGNITVNGIVKATEQVKARGHVNVESGYLEAARLTAQGDLTIGKAGESDTILIVTGDATVNQFVDVYSQASFNSLTSKYGVVVHNTESAGAVLEASSITSKIVTRSYSSEDGTYQNIQISRNATTADDSTAGALLSGGVSISKNGISAGTIAGNTSIMLATGSTSGVSARTILGTEVKLNDNTVVLSNLTHQNGTFTINPNGGQGRITSTGEMSADSLLLPTAYGLSAASLSVTNGITTESGKLTTTGETTATDIAISGSTIAIGSLEADSLSIGDGCTVVADTIKTVTTLGDNVTLGGATVTKDLTTGANATLNGVSTEGVLTTGTGSTLKNTTLKNTWRSNGTATLDKVAVNNGAIFGGTDGNAFQASDSYKSVILSGNMSEANGTGATLDLTSLALDVTNIDFTIAGESYTILTAGTGSAYTLADTAAIDIYANSYTYASVTTSADGSSITVNGQRDEARAKAELMDTEDRANTLSALEYALENNADEAVTTLHNKLGDVMHTSLKDRQELLDAISGASMTALADSQRRGIQDMQTSLRNRIIQMGGAYDEENPCIQGWAQADGGFTSSDSGDGAPGYDFNTWGATVGANVDLSENLIVGMAFSASYGEIDVDSADKATGNNDACYINFFARHQNERWVQLLILTAGMNDMDLERKVGDYTASGSTSGTSFSAYYELGYTFALDEEYSHILQPIVSASITSAQVDKYRESGSIGNAALEYDSNALVYGTVGAGLRYQGVLSQSVFERNTVLEVRAMVTADFGDKTDEASVSMAGGKVNTVSGTDTTGLGYTIGAGLSIPVQMQTTLYADVDMTLRTDYTGVRANVGLRYDF